MVNLTLHRDHLLPLPGQEVYHTTATVTAAASSHREPPQVPFAPRRRPSLSPAEQNHPDPQAVCNTTTAPSASQARDLPVSLACQDEKRKSIAQPGADRLNRAKAMPDLPLSKLRTMLSSFDFLDLTSMLSRIRGVKYEVTCRVHLASTSRK
jgi:hypothetical protein